MDITVRGFWTMLHGLGFGALYLLACSGALMELYRLTHADAVVTSERGERFLKLYLVTMSVLAWATVLTGAYILYPWYRAALPPGTVNLAAYPQKLLMSSPSTAGWHNLGMEWKEHVAWLTPISITMVAAVFIQYGRNLRHHPLLRRAVLGFTLVSFLAAGVSAFFGAMLNKVAPVQGGSVIHLTHNGDQR
jgi:hypothetical protein